MGLLSKMFGEERWQAGLAQVLSDVESQADSGRTEFVVQVPLSLFPGSPDAALDHVIAEIQTVGVIIRDVDYQSWEHTARLLVTVPEAPPPTDGNSELFRFDPEGPEKAGHLARAALNAGNYREAFKRYVSAVDKLHDFYVFEQFRNRQPSTADAWLVNGVDESLHRLRASGSDFDVESGVVEATHRLRTITTAVENAGGNATLYRMALDRLATVAPEVDVSGVYWC